MLESASGKKEKVTWEGRIPGSERDEISNRMGRGLNEKFANKQELTVNTIYLALTCIT